MCKLTDPQKSMGKDNLTIQSMDLGLKANNIITTEIEHYSSNLLLHRSRIIDIRNQYISHLDRDSTVMRKTFNIGTEENVAQFFEDLQQYCDSVGNAVGAGPLDFRTTVGSGDAVDLIRRLKHA